jgi:C4-dicarboxylate-specific signal transduction histidine kinase
VAKFEEVDLNHITKEVLALSRSELLLRNVQVRTSFWQGPLLVHGDAIELQHLLLNLIMNACEAMASMHHGQRVLRVVTSLEESGRVRVVITDSGPGIDPDVRDRIFDPFYTTKKHGLGLGLSISRSIAAVHQGQLVVRDHAAGGTEGAIDLPAAAAGARSIQSLRAPRRMEAEDVRNVPRGRDRR